MGHWLHHSFLFSPYFEELHYFSHLLRSVIEGVENRKEMISCLIEQSSWFVTIVCCCGGSWKQYRFVATGSARFSRQNAFLTFFGR